MLSELSIKDYAIIEDLTLNFSKGVNVLTGETGAGKSIVAGALGLVLGQRASSDAVKTNSTEIVVEAMFELEDGALDSVGSVLGSIGLEPSNEILIRRVVSASGKTRAYVNGSMVTVQALTELGSALVDIHGQHDHQSLLSPLNQLMILDAYGGLDADRENLALEFSKVVALKARLDAKTKDAKQRAQDIELLQYQIDEISQAAIAEDEEAGLLKQKNILSNLGRLNELTESAYGLVHGGEGSCTEKLSLALSEVKECAEIDTELSGLLESMNQAQAIVQDAAMTLRDARHKYEPDPDRLAEVLERIELIGNLKRKYGGDLKSVLKYKGDAETRLRAMMDDAQDEGDTASELKKHQALLEGLSAALSEKRKKAAEKLVIDIKKVFSELALDKAEFDVRFKDKDISANGADVVDFMFSANPGESLKQLSKIASGGELSRVMLSIKSVIRGGGMVPVLVFDEVDAGIGGKTAQNVGMKLKSLSSTHQVICITHLAQIASVAQRHFLVEKAYNKGATKVMVNVLEGADREKEIARMLSGKVTNASIGHAREIIGGQ